MEKTETWSREKWGREERQIRRERGVEEERGGGDGGGGADKRMVEKEERG